MYQERLQLILHQSHTSGQPFSKGHSVSNKASHHRIMVDPTSIVISVISLVGSLLTAGFNGWFKFHSDERQRYSESQKLIGKYRDPLLRAAQDLQSELFNITERGLLNYLNSRKQEAIERSRENRKKQESTELPNEEKKKQEERSIQRSIEDKKDYVLIYISFQVGQYLSWTYILRRQTQFFCFSTDRDSKELVRILDTIQDVFDRDNPGGPEALRKTLMLWRGQQNAIGEIMTVKEKDELLCMGYVDFKEKWVKDEDFRRWFHSIETSITNLASGSNHQVIRLKLLQHLLLDLVQVLDPKKIWSNMIWSERCPMIWENICECSYCDPSRELIRERAFPISCF